MNFDGASIFPVNDALTPFMAETKIVFEERAMQRLGALSSAVQDRYRYPEGFIDLSVQGELSHKESFFHLGSDIVCYGRRLQRVPGRTDAAPYDALQDVCIEDGTLQLPFDATEVIDNLRLERYVNRNIGVRETLRKLYYLIRPLTTRPLRKHIQRFYARNWSERPFPHWPVDTTVETLCEKLVLLSLQAKGIDSMPFVWFWPRGSAACVTMTHDVETEAGRSFCSELMDLDDAYGTKASFQIVPEKRYKVSEQFLDSIKSRGFEIGVQDLSHDGRLYDDREHFLRRAAIINRYGREFGARGFRAGVLYRKPEWFGALDFSFDMSMPNVGHLDPQRGGCCTVMPYFIGNILEIPVTTTQDYTLFYLLDQRSIDLWKQQMDLILGKNGLASFIIHPDYINEDEPKSVYADLLQYLRELRAQGSLWFALPSEIDRWWRSRNKMSVVRDGKSWRIEGEGAERAVLAIAKNVDGKLKYELAQHNP